MSFGYIEVHPVNETTKRRFVKPKCFLLRLIAPFVCTDIYPAGKGFRKHRELNLSHISWTIIAILAFAFVLSCIAEFVIQLGVNALNF